MAHPVLKALGIDSHPRLSASSPAGSVTSKNPATGAAIAIVAFDDAAACEATIARATAAFKHWRGVPAPERGLVIRAIGEEFRKYKAPLGEIVSLESGKIRSEGLGEIQEAIDIADYAVGLSRTLSGPVLQSERVAHRMYEQWLPLGPIGVISAFNFPAAVWAWNSMIAGVCGDPTIWKPSLLAPLTALACNVLADRVASAMGHKDVFTLVIGADNVVGEKLVADKRIPLISATGSTRMGRHVGQIVAQRLGRALLELGGNNAVIVTPSADLDLALKAITFSAVGTAGQRCTTARRLIIHESIADGFVERLIKAYRTIKIGDPLAEGTLVGPLVNARAVEQFEHAVALAKEQGGSVLVGGKRASGLAAELASGNFVEPTIIAAAPGKSLPISCDETFAPILYVFRYKTLDEAIAMQNGVDQGLSSAILTDSLKESETFLAVSGSGSDCGLAYVNLGTSGAEIGGAFGGEKDTGGGRESGSDAWKNYMRRQNVVINGTGEFRLAQGVQFG